MYQSSGMSSQAVGRLGVKVWVYKGERLPQPKKNRPAKTEGGK